MTNLLVNIKKNFEYLDIEFHKFLSYNLTEIFDKSEKQKESNSKSKSKQNQEMNFHLSNLEILNKTNLKFKDLENNNNTNNINFSVIQKMLLLNQINRKKAKDTTDQLNILKESFLIYNKENKKCISEAFKYIFNNFNSYSSNLSALITELSQDVNNFIKEEHKRQAVFYLNQESIRIKNFYSIIKKFVLMNLSGNEMYDELKAKVMKNIEGFTDKGEIITTYQEYSNNKNTKKLNSNVNVNANVNNNKDVMYYDANENSFLSKSIYNELFIEKEKESINKFNKDNNTVTAGNLDKTESTETKIHLFKFSYNENLFSNQHKAQNSYTIIERDEHDLFHLYIFYNYINNFCVDNEDYKDFQFVFESISGFFHGIKTHIKKLRDNISNIPAGIIGFCYLIIEKYKFILDFDKDNFEAEIYKSIALKKLIIENLDKKECKEIAKDINNNNYNNKKPQNNKENLLKNKIKERNVIEKEKEKMIKRRNSFFKYIKRKHKEANKDILNTFKNYDNTDNKGKNLKDNKTQKLTSHNKSNSTEKSSQFKDSLFTSFNNSLYLLSKDTYKVSSIEKATKNIEDSFYKLQNLINIYNPEKIIERNIENSESKENNEKNKHNINNINNINRSLSSEHKLILMNEISKNYDTVFNKTTYFTELMKSYNTIVDGLPKSFESTDLLIKECKLRKNNTIMTFPYLSEQREINLRNLTNNAKRLEEMLVDVFKYSLTHFHFLIKKKKKIDKLIEILENFIRKKINDNKLCACRVKDKEGINNYDNANQSSKLLSTNTCVLCKTSILKYMLSSFSKFFFNNSKFHYKSIGQILQGEYFIKEEDIKDLFFNETSFGDNIKLSYFFYCLFNYENKIFDFKTIAYCFEDLNDKKISLKDIFEVKSEDIDNNNDNNKGNKDSSNNVLGKFYNSYIIRFFMVFLLDKFHINDEILQELQLIKDLFFENNKANNLKNTNNTYNTRTNPNNLESNSLVISETDIIVYKLVMSTLTTHYNINKLLDKENKLNKNIYNNNLNNTIDNDNNLINTIIQEVTEINQTNINNINNNKKKIVSTDSFNYDSSISLSVIFSIAKLSLINLNIEYNKSKFVSNLGLIESKMESIFKQVYPIVSETENGVTSYYFDKSPYANQYKAFTSLKNTISEVISNHKLEIEFDLTPFGSITQFIGNTESDVDTYCEIKSYSCKRTKIKFFKELMYAIQTKYKTNLRNNGSVLTPRLFTFKLSIEGIKVDLNFLGELGILNSNLLFQYGKIDLRFHIMGNVIKHVLKKNSIARTDREMDYINSYAWMLFIMTYLQDKEDPPVLPKLLLKNKARKKQNKIENVDDGLDFFTNNHTNNRFNHKAGIFKTVIKCGRKVKERIGNFDVKGKHRGVFLSRNAMMNNKNNNRIRNLLDENREVRFYQEEVFVNDMFIANNNYELLKIMVQFSSMNKYSKSDNFNYDESSNYDNDADIILNKKPVSLLMLNFIEYFAFVYDPEKMIIDCSPEKEGFALLNNFFDYHVNTKETELVRRNLEKEESRTQNWLMIVDPFDYWYNPGRVSKNSFIKIRNKLQEVYLSMIVNGIFYKEN